MKKILAMILAMLLVMSMTTAFAAEGDEGGEGGTTTYTDVSTVTITKTYKAVNSGVSPEETFSFSEFTKVPYSETQEVGENPAASFPSTMPSISSITYNEGDATSDGKDTGTKTATITLPSYSAVGVYTYSFYEVTPETKTAGVTYKPETELLYLVVTVVEENGKKRIAAVHCEGSHEANASSKTDTFVNTYESGTLAVDKKVTGNLGDKSKYFKVTVEFTAASGETINSTITYSGGKYGETETAITNNKAEIEIKNGDTVTFTNVPEGVTWKVTEDDYTAAANGGYDAATYSKQTDTMTAGGKATCTITNNKEITPDTGVILQYAPYIAILAVVLAGAIMMIIRRRRNNED